MLAVYLYSCEKSDEITPVIPTPNTPYTQTAPLQETAFAKYVLHKGKHYANNDSTKIEIVNVAEMKFTVKFDSSAIYKTVDANNQYDINKLYGFSDNNEFHHSYSARFGWRWSDNALRLFAYNYNKGVREFKELAVVAFNKEIKCGIKISGSNYIFIVDGVETVMPRAAATPKGSGYKLYPYFGGDEMAPHDITILIKELQ